MSSFYISVRNLLALAELPAWVSRRRHIGGWIWRAPRFRNLGKALRATGADLMPLEERRLDLCRVRARRYQRKLAREGTPHRSIPRHIKEKMREARTVRP